MIPFIQSSEGRSTLMEWKSMLIDNEYQQIGLFAYATDSGVSQLSMHLGEFLSRDRVCRWVIGIDYARSQPTAIRKLAELGNSEVRIYDGGYVVNSESFVPRRSYHLKTVLTISENGFPCKQIVGSGNLSATGLRSGIEAGCVVDYLTSESEYGGEIMKNVDGIWNKSIPYEDIIEKYERSYYDINSPVINTSVGQNRKSIFWIDVGYITKNRGQNKPGNQFDLPRGFHVNLGLPSANNPSKNTLLGELNIITPVGKIVARNMRFGNNSMEKLSLPVPESYGYESYDGKILVFTLHDKAVKLDAFENEDFFRIYKNRITSYSEMQSGRLYGTASLLE